MSVRSWVKHVLTEQQNRKYQKLLQCRQISYEQWVVRREAEYSGGMEQKQPVTDGQNSVLEQNAMQKQSGAPEKPAAQFMVWHSEKGRLAKRAQEWLQVYFQEHPEVLLVYGDEDVWDEAGRHTPWFKPDWSPDTFRSYFYFGSVVAVRKELWERYSGTWKRSADDSYDKVQAFTAELVEMAGGFQKGCCSVGHLPKVLFHGESEAVQRAYLQKQYVQKKEVEKQDSPYKIPLVSVIIPSKDNPQVLEKALCSLLDTAGEIPLEIWVVDNGSRGENKERIEKLILDLTNHKIEASEQQKFRDIHYLYEPMEFHFSRMCNLGAEHAAGEILLFLNDDVELCCNGWLHAMVEKARQEYTGAVGLKLYYPNTIRIQHAGITNLPMGPVHKLQFLEDGTESLNGWSDIDRNVLAVTGACLMVSRQKWDEAGGFDEKLRVAFNDVALCFHLYHLGYHNVVVNTSYAYHHESLSRGEDEAAEKLERLMGERKRLYEAFPALEGKDPYYAEGWNRDGLDTRIRPACLTGANTIQYAKWQQTKWQQYRQDKCLLLRIEDCREGQIQGYSVVLGDNNACYEKRLVLKQEENPRGVMSEPLAAQYRPDLEENMTDQSHVALCGFRVQADGMDMPPGRYRIGITARNRVTGLKLINWSNRYLTVK